MPVQLSKYFVVIFTVEAPVMADTPWSNVFSRNRSESGSHEKVYKSQGNLNRDVFIEVRVIKLHLSLIGRLIIIEEPNAISNLSQA